MLLTVFTDDSEDGSDIADETNDGGEDTFMKSYSDALNSQLKDTTLKKSFIHANEESSDKNKVMLSSSAVRRLL